jgi:hypothetical protein
VREAHEQPLKGIPRCRVVLLPCQVQGIGIQSLAVAGAGNIQARAAAAPKGLGLDLQAILGQPVGLLLLQSAALLAAPAGCGVQQQGVL